MTIGQVRDSNFMKIGVYILHCSNDRYYVGSTNDISRRLQEHMSGAVLSTKHLRPSKLVFFQKFSTLAEARKWERWIKSKKSQVIIGHIVREGKIRATSSVG